MGANTKFNEILGYPFNKRGHQSLRIPLRPVALLVTNARSESLCDLVSCSILTDPYTATKEK